MSDLEYFKSLFDREQVRKVELNNEVNIPIGIITLISGGVILVFKETVTTLCVCPA
jgi:mannitol/fructose-specific phosphotransferase system IIA component